MFANLNATGSTVPLFSSLEQILCSRYSSSKGSQNLGSAVPGTSNKADF